MANADALGRGVGPAPARTPSGRCPRWTHPAHPPPAPRASPREIRGGAARAPARRSGRRARVRAAARSPRVERRHDRRHLRHLVQRDVARHRGRQRGPRVGGAHPLVRMRQHDRQPAGVGERDDVEWVERAHQHDPAEQRRARGCRRAGPPPPPPPRGTTRSSVPHASGRPRQCVRRHRPGHGRGGAAALAAGERQALAAPTVRGRACAAGALAAPPTPRAPRCAVPDRPAGRDAPGPLSSMPAYVEQLGRDPVAGAGDRQAEHVEARVPRCPPTRARTRVSRIRAAPARGCR